MIISSFAEILSIGAVLPFLGAISSPNRIFEHQAAQPFIHALGLISADQILLPLTIVFGMAALLAGALRTLLLWVSIRLSFAAGSDLSNKIFRRTLYQSYDIHVGRNSSEVINGISNKVNEVIYYILVPILTLTSVSFMLIVILAALLTIAPGVALVAFGVLGVIYAVITKLTRSSLKSDSQKIASESTHVLKILQEGLGGIRDVLIDGSQEVYCASYRTADQQLRRAQGNNQFIGQFPRYSMEALGMLVIAVLAYVLTKQADGSAQAIPTLAALALGAQRLLPAMQQAYWARATIEGAQTSLQDTLVLLDQQLPNHTEQAPEKPMIFKRRIRLNQISFQYSHQRPQVLKGVDLIIPKGSRIGFVGSTGSGKSTLIDIVMGLLQPTEGTLEVDDQTITSGNLRSWQSCIAHVPQAIYLADCSIEENIAIGEPKDQIDHARVRVAAKQAQIAEIIESWPHQYQTEVGERGIQLSGGQRQRIGIARALYKKAEVIIFDEATSALDNETEQAVMQAIESLSENITILIIAHRLSTIKNCTQIVELSNGIIQQKK